MIADYPLLLVALLLLWFPRQLLRFRSRARKLASSARGGAPVPEQVVRDDSLKAKVEFAKTRNWVDLVRAFTGASAIFHFAFAASGEGGMAARGAQVFILIVAVIAQMTRYNHGRLTLFAPVFFVMGLSFVLLGWKTAFFACATTWIIGGVLPGPVSFLFVFAAVQGMFGMLFRGAPTSLLATSLTLTVLPTVLSAMLKRPLVRVNKTRRKANA